MQYCHRFPSIPRVCRNCLQSCHELFKDTSQTAGFPGMSKYRIYGNLHIFSQKGKEVLMPIVTADPELRKN